MNQLKGERQTWEGTRHKAAIVQSPWSQDMSPFSTLLCDSIQVANQGRLPELSYPVFIRASLQRQD